MRGGSHEVEIPDTFFPVNPEEVEELIKGEGFSSLISGRSGDGAKNKSKIAKAVCPSLLKTAFSQKSLSDLISEFKGSEKEREALLSSLTGEYRNQKEVYKEVLKALKSGRRVVIFNFKKITFPQSRVNLAGLIMDYLFNKAKEDRKRRFLVLEEAHNFAPEKGFGDVSSGRDNLALVMARKVASEGRKFNLGLCVITQRPAQVSKFVLSQTNTQVMFKTINSADIDAISTFVEYASSEVGALLPSLQTGMAFVCGLGAPFPFLVKVE